MVRKRHLINRPDMGVEMAPQRNLRIDPSQGTIPAEAAPSQAKADRTDAAAGESADGPVENCPVVRCHSVILRRLGRGRTRIMFL